MAKPRVLILDEGFVSGALAALGLSDAGCEVHVLAATGGRGAYRGSRGTWEQLPRLGNPTLPDMIRSRIETASFDVVYPVTEPLQAMAWDSGWPGVFPSPDAATRRLLRSKRCVSAAMSGAGVAVPAEADASTEASVRAGVRTLGLPVVVKGAVGRGGSATVIARDAEQAWLAASRMLERSNPPFLQEWVRGNTWLVGGVFDHGSPIRLFGAKKTAQFPADTGPAAELLSSSEPQLLDAAIKAFKTMRVTGVASADFIQHPDGRFLFLELNPRPWGSMAAAAQAGVDLWEPLVRLWRGAPTTPSLEFETGVRVGTWPLYIVAPRSWGAAAAQLPRDLSRALAVTGRDPAFAWHLAARCARVAMGWRPA